MIIMCIYNQFIKNRKYVKNKKNGGVIPTVTDRRIEYVPTGCGNCMECRKQKAREWQVRLLEDIKTNTNGKFITLTFSNESIKELSSQKITRVDKKSGQIQEIPIETLTGYDKDNSIATRAIRLFTERWRKTYGKTIRHWLITELGHNGTENIHLHGIIWTNEHIDRVREHWQYGYIWPRPETKVKTYVNGATVNYMMKYVSKIDHKHKEYKPIILTSNGIGAKYTETRDAKKNQYRGRETDETYRTSTGHKMKIPIYWRNKLYTEAEKEALWINKLDKQVRWVDGIKYDISQSEKDYNQAVQEARRKNQELGYGRRPNENRKKYEEDQREILIQTRIQNARKA